MCTPLVQRTPPLVTAMSPTSRQPLASRDASPSDDDIEYLHTNPAPNASLSSPVDLAPIGHQRQVNGTVSECSRVGFPGTDSSLSGIKLHVDANTSSLELDEYTPKVLPFHKADAGVVHIGRRSGTEVTSEKAATESDSKNQAMFRCAVVSRVHAKIVFSDSGHVSHRPTPDQLNVMYVFNSSRAGLCSRPLVPSWHSPPQSRGRLDEDGEARDPDYTL